MEDSRIVELYWARSEQAIPETEAKYGAYLKHISYNILADQEDVKECVNDTYHDAWNTMPPHHPIGLSAFLGKIIRRNSIDRLRKKYAAKRGGGEYPLALSELEECVSGNTSVERDVLNQELAACVNAFLATLSVTERRIFLCRYWYMDSVADIAGWFGFPVDGK